MRRVVLLGIDSVGHEWLETFVRRGVMPTVKALMERGTFSPMTSFYPVDTGTNWASIATGASPLVHVGEDGRPSNPIRGLQEPCGYVTQLPPRTGATALRLQREFLRPMQLTRASSRGDSAWRGLETTGHAGGLPLLAAELPIVPGPASRYHQVESLWALVHAGPTGYTSVSVHADRDAARPLVSVGL